MNIDDIFPSKWLRAADVEKLADETTETAVVTIDRITMEEIGQGAEAQAKPIVYFRNVEAGLVLNKTNANSIATLYGKNTNEWIGKNIGLFAAEVDYQGKQVLSIRVRLKAPKVGRAPMSPVSGEEIPF